MATRLNPYSTELAYLRNYFKAGFDPHEYAFMLERFFDEVLGEQPDNFDPDEPWELSIQ